jgi:hypothetical protein
MVIIIIPLGRVGFPGIVSPMDIVPQLSFLKFKNAGTLILLGSESFMASHACSAVTMRR